MLRASDGRAQDTWPVAVMGLLTIVSTWAWVTGFVLGFFRVRLYLTVAKHTLLFLTLVQVVLLLSFHTPPPVDGCGPVYSFPSPQVTLSAYALSVFLYYETTFESHRTKLRIAMVTQMVAVQYSVLWLGMASPPGCLAGVAVGACVAGVMHRGMVGVYDRADLLGSLSMFFECDDSGSAPPPPSRVGLDFY